MSEPDFESQLVELYRKVPPQLDDDAFLRQIEAHLDSQIRTRRWLLSSLGLLGGAVTLAVLVRFEAPAATWRFFSAVMRTGIDVLSIASGGAAALALVVLLALPAFMRTVIDPK